MTSYWVDIELELPTHFYSNKLKNANKRWTIFTLSECRIVGLRF